MRPPLAGKRAAARRLADEVRRRLEPVERALPVKLPGRASAATDAGGGAGRRDAPAGRAAPTADETAARIDAARARLRATIEPPPEDGDG